MTIVDKSPFDDEEDIALKQASDWSVRMAHDGLSPEEEAEFRAWCDQDPLNLAAFEDVARAWRAVGQAASSPALLGMRRAALDDLHRAQARRWRRSPALGWVVGGMLAAACAATALVFVHLQPRTYDTGLGERRVVALADGSKVSMDGATQVRVLYAGGRRQFWLDRGRAKFDVAKDPLHPFTVTAGGEMVVATGTQFSVELLRNQVRVALYEGHVTLWRAPEKNDGLLQPVMAGGRAAEQILTPGREMVAQADTINAQVIDADPVRSLSWEAGQLIFDDEPLASAVERVNRYAEHPLRVSEAAGRDVRISGVFAAGDTEAFVAGVISLFPLRAIHNGDVITLDLDTGRVATKLQDPVHLG